MAGLELEGKVALVTGGSRGIGAAIARGLVAEGARVVINSTESSRESAERLVDDITSTDKFDVTPILWIPGDISQESTGKFLVDETVKRFRKLDILIHSAGITDNDLLMRMNGDRWRKVIETNLSSGFYVAQPAIRQMSRQREGTILFISSVAAHGNPGQASYSAAKAGLEGLMRTIAVEYMSEKRPIRANAIAFGAVDTDMVRELPEQAREKLVSMTPLGRLITPEEAADAALLLVSPRSKIINGAVIDADGGMLRR